MCTWMLTMWPSASAWIATEKWLLMMARKEGRESRDRLTFFCGMLKAFLY